MTSSSDAHHHLHHHLLPITYASTPTSPITFVTSTVTVTLHDRALSPSNPQLQHPLLLIPQPSISTHQWPFSPASPSCVSPLQLPPLSPLPPCTTLHQSSLHQALPLNDTHFCDKKNDEADC